MAANCHPYSAVGYIGYICVREKPTKMAEEAKKSEAEQRAVGRLEEEKKRRYCVVRKNKSSDKLAKL